jgi:hypothetical protein
MGDDDVVEVGPPVPNSLLLNVRSSAMIPSGGSTSSSRVEISASAQATICRESRVQSTSSEPEEKKVIEETPSGTKSSKRKKNHIHEKPAWVDAFWRMSSNVPNQYDCLVCEKMKVIKSRKRAPNTGWTNLSSHMDKDHANWRTWNLTDGPTIMKYFSTKAHNYYDWISLLIDLNLPFSAVENPALRRTSKMDKISTDTVVKYADLLVEDLEKKIAILDRKAV